MKNFNVLSVVIGSAITILSFIGFEYLFALIFTEVTLNSIYLENAINLLPIAYYILVILVNVLAAFIAGTLPVLIGDEQLEYSVIIGTIATACMLLNNYFIPFPDWYKLTSLCIPIPSCYIGGFCLRMIFERTFIVFNFHKNKN